MSVAYRVAGRRFHDGDAVSVQVAQDDGTSRRVAGTLRVVGGGVAYLERPEGFVWGPADTLLAEGPMRRTDARGD